MDCWYLAVNTFADSPTWHATVLVVLTVQQAPVLAASAVVSKVASGKHGQRQTSRVVTFTSSTAADHC